MGPFIYALLGTSKDITLGPTAIMSLMTAAFGTSPIANDPTPALLLSLLGGILQLVLGFLHLGLYIISVNVLLLWTLLAVFVQMHL